VTTLFWLAWTIDALVALVFVAFFLIGIGDGTVSSFNIVLWLVTLAVVGGVTGGSFALRSAGKRIPSLILALALAVPGLLVGLFFLVLILGNPDWR
jgi:hypothetical protein